MGVSTPHTYIRLLQAVCRDRRDRLARVVPGRCEGNEFQRRYHSARRAAVGLIGITDVERAVQGDAVPRQAVWKRVIKRNRRLSLQVHIRGVGGGYQADHPERQYERLLHLVSPIEIIANRRQNHRFTMYANGYNAMRGLPHNDAETRRYSKDSAGPDFIPVDPVFRCSAIQRRQAPQSLDQKHPIRVGRVVSIAQPQPPRWFSHISGSIRGDPRARN